MPPAENFRFTSKFRMSDKTDKLEPGAEGLAYSDNISVDWQAVDNAPDSNHIAMVNESNELFLRTVAAIGEFPKEKSSDLSAEMHQEIARIDSKLNLLLDLVGQLIYQAGQVPETAPARITSTHIEWQGEQLPQAGSHVFIKAYIQRGTPKPLCFYGTVESSGGNTARVVYSGLSETVQAWLEKLIFRHHRRTVAQQKSD